VKAAGALLPWQIATVLTEGVGAGSVIVTVTGVREDSQMPLAAATKKVELVVTCGTTNW
jgi:hypothetical protein